MASTSLRDAKKSTVLTLLRNLASYVTVLFPDLEPEIRQALSGGNDDILSRWKSSMLLELKDSVKYCKAVRRLTNSNATCLHACAYKDFPALVSSVPFLNVEWSRVEQSKKDELWDFVATINESFAWLEAWPVPVPTRQEIADNITRHSKSKNVEGEKTSSNSFFLTVSSQFQQNKQDLPASLRTKTDAEWQQMCVAFNAFLDSKPPKSGKTVEALFNKNDVSVFELEWPALAEVRDMWKATTVHEKEWRCILQLTNFARLNGGIPTNLMSNIETYAQQIASDIMNGKMRMEDMDVQKLGQDVLQGCSATDISALASNVDKLFPSIQQLSGSIGINLPST
jgi:hypothetical protein